MSRSQYSIGTNLLYVARFWTNVGFWLQGVAYEITNTTTNNHELANETMPPYEGHNALKKDTILYMK